jgi:hypothetical protein
LKIAQQERAVEEIARFEKTAKEESLPLEIAVRA